MNTLLSRAFLLHAGVAWLFCAAIAAGTAHADAEHAREYLAKAQERLAANDMLVVDNLLRLAEAALEDVPTEQSAPLRAEIGELRKQFDLDASVRKLRILVQKMDKLFDEAELTLGAPNTGGAATLSRIDQLLADQETTRTLGDENSEKFRKRLALFRRAHQRKLEDRGLNPDADAVVEVESPSAETRTLFDPRPTSQGAQRTGETPATASSQLQKTSGSGAESANPGTAQQPVQLILFGGTNSNVGMLIRIWRMLLVLAASLIGMVKAKAPVLGRFERLAAVRDFVERVPMTMWAVLIAGVGLWWMIDGWIIYGLGVSFAMVGMAIYVGVDVLERVGLLGTPAAAGIRRWGVWFIPLAILLAGAHLFIGGGWMVI